MYRTNIEFVVSATNSDKPMYGILSLVIDTVDSMKSDLTNFSATEEEKKLFRSAMKDIVSGLIKLDHLVDRVKEGVAD
ncbi:hypothetical protein CH373_02630 [Leptospira perolatii]|uniref:Uncharacterized protein n=1 Tax=Leptospira perolatii TaxID=2023191 RepID=A0A2M9ZS76_9LEPT|nr:hypothetical protein [Leptospira perolatii]PJZ71413.1 hypothetical protein CH360_02630 [Leptospira perolatii]PJZ74947.1 hypothetical protein CH373_02630 [Leptospira perolatii]